MPPTRRPRIIRKPAPRIDAPIEEQKKHAEEVLEDEEYKKKPDDFQELNDEAQP
jgi:hypothetical protein